MARWTMTPTDFDTVLDECLATMVAGESVDACLRKHPQHASALRPLLSMAAGLIALPRPEPRASAVEAGRQGMLTAFREPQRARDGAISPLSRHAGRVREFLVPKQGMQVRHVLRFAAAMVLALFVGTELAVVASAGAIPGDPLYGVKRSWEETRLALTFREEDREQLLEHLVERRQDEVREMVRQGRVGTLDLEGPLQPAGDGRWRVDGLTLQFSEETTIDGRLEPGIPVWVRAQVRDDGTLVALSVHIRTRLLPSAATTPPVTPGDMPNGRPSPSVTPAPQRTPDLTRPPQGTASPLPEATPAPANTLRTDPTSVPTENYEPENTPEPTQSGEADQTPGPTKTHEPDDEAEPTKTHEPEATPKPTKMHEPEETPEPTKMHEPEETPKPTKMHEPEETPKPTKTHEPDDAPEPTRTPESGSTPAPPADLQRATEAGGSPGETVDGG
jgi:hypothetical protein